MVGLRVSGKGISTTRTIKSFSSLLRVSVLVIHALKYDLRKVNHRRV